LDNLERVAIGYSTTREPQNTQARWLTELATLFLPQVISPGLPPAPPVWTTYFSRPGRMSIMGKVRMMNEI